MNFLFLLFFCYAVPLTHLRLMCHLHMCTDKWYPTANTLCPHDRKTLELCHSYTQNSAKAPTQRISWLLVAVSNATLIALQRWLVEEERKKERKKERNKMNNSDFQQVQVCHFKIVTTHSADWGRLYKLLCVPLDMSICFPAMISLCTC